ncbi:MAG: type II toxin-antitoxin system HicA family toxin [Gammaproteobacteria bacterium]
MNGKEVIKRLKEAGFIVVRSQGSHFRLARGAIKVSVPVHSRRDLKPGTLASIERQSRVKLK